MSVINLVFGTVSAVLLAVLLNEVRQRAFKRTVQTITYLPYFLSWIILSGILIKFLSPGSSARCSQNHVEAKLHNLHSHPSARRGSPSFPFLVSLPVP